MSGPIIEKQREMILAAEKQGKGATYKTFVKLSGPGWLQSAITLGGGSLAGSLYLGIIGGYELMWLQPRISPEKWLRPILSYWGKINHPIA